MRDRSTMKAVAGAIKAAAILATAIFATAPGVRAADAVAKAVEEAVIAVPVDGRTVKLRYDIFVGGIYASGADFTVALAPSSYDVALRFAIDGWASRLVEGTMSAYSRGNLVATGVQPIEAGSSSKWNRKERLIALRYSADGGVELARAVPPVGDGGKGVPDEHRRNTFDLSSAILALVKGFEKGGNCNGTLPVFDGRKRYDLVVEDLGADTLDRSRYSMFHGPAHACKVSWDRITRFNNDDASEYQRQTGESPDSYRELTAWLAPLSKELPPVPVRLAMSLPIGGARVHLVRAEVVDKTGTYPLRMAAR